jgi:hypothetical protein
VKVGSHQSLSIQSISSLTLISLCLYVKICLAVLLSIHSVIGYPLINKIRPDGLFWNYKSPICRDGSSRLSLVPYLLYAPLVLFYFYLLYYCHIYQVDAKYILRSTRMTPLILVIIGSANVVFDAAGGDAVMDYYEFETCFTRLLIAVCVTASDLSNMGEAVSKVTKIKVANTRFKGEQNATKVGFSTGTKKKVSGSGKAAHHRAGSANSNSSIHSRIESKEKISLASRSSAMMMCQRNGPHQEHPRSVREVERIALRDGKIVVEEGTPASDSTQMSFIYYRIM